ncbi:MAG: globin [Alicyclobacillus sp.]|nr:globin [Alicyclobacillus sp.]
METPSNPSASDRQPTVYELIGGAETVARLVDAFYSRVVRHPGLRPLFPDDITPVRNKQYRFLTQFFGGPRLYSDVYGPPMLRARHLPHPITPKRAEEWLECMAGALEEAGIQGPLRDFIFARLSQTAYHMVNTPDADDSGRPPGQDLPSRMSAPD